MAETNCSPRIRWRRASRASFIEIAILTFEIIAFEIIAYTFEITYYPNIPSLRRGFGAAPGEFLDGPGFDRGSGIGTPCAAFGTG